MGNNRRQNASQLDYVTSANLERINNAFEIINELTDALEQSEIALSKGSNRNQIERSIDDDLASAITALHRLRTTEYKIELEKKFLASIQAKEKEEYAAWNHYGSFPQIVKEVAQLTGLVGKPRKLIKKPNQDLVEHIVHARLSVQNDEIRSQYLDTRDELLSVLKSASDDTERADAISHIDACELEYSKQFKRFTQGWAENDMFKVVESEIAKAWAPGEKKGKKSSAPKKNKKLINQRQRKKKYQWRGFSAAEKERKERQQKTFMHFRSFGSSSIPSRTHSHRSGRIFLTAGRMNPRAKR